MNLTKLAHEKIQYLKPHVIHAVDATTGNGKDALMLAGVAQYLFCFDIQQQALDASKQRICQSTSTCKTQWILAGHETMSSFIKVPVDICMFNLGYLPGGDHNITTQTDTTIKALQAAIDLLAPSGILSIMCYPGHPEGYKEHKAVKKWLQGHLPKQIYSNPKHDEATPRLYILQNDL